MNSAFFDGSTPLLRTTVVGVLAYIILVAVLRASGKRSLAKMNAFDFVITIALGSTLASILLNNDVSLAQGVLALILLIGLQFLITWASVRIRWIRRLVTGEPSLLVYRGEYRPAALRRARVTREEVEAAARSAGLAAPEAAEAVVLETDGSFSVVHRHNPRADSVSIPASLFRSPDP